MASKEEELFEIEITFDSSSENNVPFRQPIGDKPYVARTRERVRSFAVTTLLVSTAGTYVALVVFVATGAVSAADAAAMAKMTWPLAALTSLALAFYFRPDSTA